MSRALEAGTKFKDGLLIVDLEKKITMGVIQEVTDSVDNMIKFTVDYPGNYKSGKFPV